MEAISKNYESKAIDFDSYKNRNKSRSYSDNTNVDNYFTISEKEISRVNTYNSLFKHILKGNNNDNNGTFTRKEMNEMDNEFKDLKKDILDAEKRIQDTEKRIYTNNKDLENRLDKNFDEIKSLFKDYKQELKDSNKKSEESIVKLETKIDNLESKLESKIDSSNKWIIGLCLTTIIGIAAMVITVVLK
ncbi:hypothetical protein GKD08_04065 [Paeniclostridium sordellii]|uniref:hypothetical protein n=1 Tax=Clostridia TaxID=186801 RepID=UPI0012B0A11E|nr:MULTISPECIES: hypothetical protein [Clostridia]MDU4415254.1 hypothetical protein [Paeniclostridium sordellii]MDU4477926.1 hypothetical protein [Clostridium sp.]MRZ27938.1 hypothetical protein [Paeniclostridium sordellii]